MNDIPLELASNAVKAFLASQYDKKTETEQKQLAKAVESNDLLLISTLNEKLTIAKDKYQLDNWMDNAANKMANQISFGTHISKGVHSGSKGDNISFEPQSSLPDGIVGHQSINNHKLDASGNAAALPLFSFFDFDVDTDKKIMDYIIYDSDSFKSCLSNNKKLSAQYFQIFRTLLTGEISVPCSSEYNKQVLWPTNHKTDAYICTIPLYPSSLTNSVYEKIQHIQYSNDVKIAKKNRFSSSAEKTPYVTLLDIATVTIGGSNPQGVSRHMSKQGGRNYLLPSLPSIIKQERAFKLSKFANSIFSTSMEYNAREAIQSIFKSIKDTRNIVDVRDARKSAIDGVLYQIFAAAEDIRTTMPAGWSKDYELDRVEKLWLDPKRADLEGEEEFKAEREQDDAWHSQIVHIFARWLNTLMQAEFKEIASNFGDAEHLDWEHEIEDMKKRYERAGKGVFL